MLFNCCCDLNLEKFALTRAMKLQFVKFLKALKGIVTLDENYF